jgi:dipeptidyl-peptidase-4
VHFKELAGQPTIQPWFFPHFNDMSLSVMSITYLFPGKFVACLKKISCFFSKLQHRFCTKLHFNSLFSMRVEYRCKPIAKAIIMALFTFGFPPLFSQSLISLEDIFQRQTFQESIAQDLNWTKTSGTFTAKEDQGLYEYEVKNGARMGTIIDPATLPQGFTYIHYTISNDKKYVLLLTDRQAIYRRSYTGIYYVYNTATQSLSRLTAEGRQSYATFSPDSKNVGFVQENNLYIKSLGEGNILAITTDGLPNELIHGSTDWVYEEEFYITKGFFWSPDSKRIAYYSFHEAHVNSYTLQLWGSEIQPYPRHFTYKYPKAGEQNAFVEVTVYDLEKQTNTKVDLGAEKDQYVPRMEWTQDPNILSVRVLNRLQNELTLLHVHTHMQTTDTVLQEKSTHYVHINYSNELIYLNDRQHFIIASERTGFKHYYLYQMDGKLVRALTAGDFDATGINGISQGRKTLLYYTSTEVSPLERHVYQVELDGKGKKQLTSTPGIHNFQMSPDCAYYFHYFHNDSLPNQIDLYKTGEAKPVKTITKNENLLQAAKKFQFTGKQYFQFTPPHGQALNGYVLYPANFNPENKYPVLLFQYSGPGSQQVTKGWGGGVNYFWHQYLAQLGYATVVVDGRGTGFRGTAFRNATYMQLGKLESEDQLATAQYLATLPWVDASRIGIWGWSYGGFISSLSLLQGPELFKMAIAVAPAISWRFYDTIYTERYMRRPSDNPEGYNNWSPVVFAKHLQGKFLLVHGTADDNVHIQHAITLQQALIQHGKQFDVFYYPDRNHGISGGNTRLHLYEMMTNFIRKNL